MNICCGENIGHNKDLTDKYDPLYLTLSETTLKFDENEGVFHVYDSNESRGFLNDKQQLIIELKEKLELKDEEINDYKNKISDLDDKIKKMEEILLIDEKEQQYIGLIGENNE